MEYFLKYIDKRSTYEAFRIELHRLMDSLCAELKDSCVIESRTKTIESFNAKINRPGKNYSDPLTDVTDLVGVRIIANTLDDVDRVVDILRAEFAIDEKNSADKSKTLDPDKFGYLSQHLIIQISKSRYELSEWSKFRDLKAEVQVRTALQHTWSAIYHPLDYKSTSSIPLELKRRMFRLSALFEIADDELNGLMNQANEIKRNYAARPYNKILELPINRESLELFIHKSREFSYWEGKFNDLPSYTSEASNWQARDVEMPIYCGFKTLGDLENMLTKLRGWWEGYLLQYFKNGSITKNGILLYALISNYPDILNESVLSEKFGFNNPSKTLLLARRLNPRLQ